MLDEWALLMGRLTTLTSGVGSARRSSEAEGGGEHRQTGGESERWDGGGSRSGSRSRSRSRSGSGSGNGNRRDLAALERASIRHQLKSVSGLRALLSDAFDQLDFEAQRAGNFGAQYANFSGVCGAIPKGGGRLPI